LCAAKVPEDKIEKFVEVVNKYSGVTHNYFRDHEYNIWFTFIAPDMNLIKIISVKLVDLPGLMIY